MHLQSCIMRLNALSALMLHNAMQELSANMLNSTKWSLLYYAKAKELWKEHMTCKMCMCTAVKTNSLSLGVNNVIEKYLLLSKLR